MSFYFVKTPKFVQSFYKDCTWKINTDKKEIYLTFDDGPTPIVTQFVLDTLNKYNAKATFFCIGKNIENNSVLYQNIIDQGHVIGNHTLNHLNGWRTNNDRYLESIRACDLSIGSNKSKTFFRPPYGKIKKSQIKILNNNGYQIIMWSVLSGDFDTRLTKENCLKNIIQNTTKGDIVVFHDSEKAFKKVNYVLPKMLAYFSKKGYIFKTL